MSTFEKIYELVAKIPRGKVATYKALATLSGTNPKVVGYALHRNIDPENTPCHRVINSKGKVSEGYAFGGPKIQQKMLEDEGVIFNENGTTDLKRFGYLID